MAAFWLESQCWRGPVAENGSSFPTEGLRLQLLTNSPTAFRRRNLFVDTVVGGQVFSTNIPI